MNKVALEKALIEVKNGNEIEREKMIQYYKPYILNVVSNICKKYVSWSNDEASIGLIAFNRAMETFNENEGRTFTNYVYLLIKRDLIDYFRKEKKEKHLSFYMDKEQEEEDFSTIEAEKSIEAYKEKTETTKLVEEILELNNQLQKFNIAFEELERFSPKHRDTRQMVKKMAFDFIHYEDLVQDLVRKHYLPISKFVKKTGYRLKTVERHRKYLITLILIVLHPEWKNLSTYVQLEPGSVTK